jgi:hypothetical protein
MHRFLTFLEWEEDCQVPRGLIWCGCRGPVAIPRDSLPLSLIARGRDAGALKRARLPSHHLRVLGCLVRWCHSNTTSSTCPSK